MKNQSARDPDRNRNQDREQSQDGTQIQTDDSPPGHYPQQCPDCETALITSQSESSPHCPTCGLIVEKPHQTAAITPGAEISDQQYPQDQLTTQTQLNTTIGNTQSCSSHPHQLSRLRNRQTEANYRGLQYLLAYGCQEIKRMGSQLSLPDTVQVTSAKLIKTAQEVEIIAPSSIEAIATAALSAVLQMNGVPRTTAELAVVSKVTLSEIQTAKKKLNTRLNLELPPPRAIQYINRFADTISSTCDVTLTKNSQRQARHMLREIEEIELSGPAPTVIAAASLYAASYLTNTDLSIRDAAAGCDVDPRSITVHYPRLLASHPQVSLSVADIDDISSRHKLSDRLPRVESGSPR